MFFLSIFINLNKLRDFEKMQIQGLITKRVNFLTKTSKITKLIFKKKGKKNPSFNMKDLKYLEILF